MKNNIDYKSRFRILKGGPLVVSALLISASVGVTEVSALDITEEETTVQTADTTSEDITVSLTNGEIIIADGAKGIDATGGTVSSGHTISNANINNVTNRCRIIWRTK